LYSYRIFLDDPDESFEFIVLGFNVNESSPQPTPSSGKREDLPAAWLAMDIATREAGGLRSSLSSAVAAEANPRRRRIGYPAFVAR
jgi:hypothetical protein